MATIKEKDLPIAVSVNDTDYLRMVTDGGASENIEFTNIRQTLAPKGKYLKGAWTATSSSATGTQLTAALSLTKGVWLVSFTVPPYTQTNRMAQVYLEGNDYRVANNNYLQGYWIVEVTTSKSVSVKAGASASCTWDSGYLNRGGIYAIRMAIDYDTY